MPGARAAHEWFAGPRVATRAQIAKGIDVDLRVTRDDRATG